MALTSHQVRSRPPTSALVVVVTVASLFGFVERARQVVLETGQRDAALHGSRPAGRRPDRSSGAWPCCGGGRSPGGCSRSPRSPRSPPTPRDTRPRRCRMPWSSPRSPSPSGGHCPAPRSPWSRCCWAWRASAFARFGTEVDDEVLTEVLAVLAAWALGRGYRLGRIRTRLLEDRTRLLEQQARHLTQEQTTVAALAAAHERAHIARELHDVVANDVGIIVARAGAARRCEQRRQQRLGRGARVHRVARQGGPDGHEAAGRGAPVDRRRRGPGHPTRVGPAGGPRRQGGRDGHRRPARGDR